MFTSRIRAVILIAGLGLLFTAGCGKSRWIPTDPRQETPDTANLTVDDSWSIGIGTTINAAALENAIYEKR